MAPVKLILAGVLENDDPVESEINIPPLPFLVLLTAIIVSVGATPVLMIPVMITPSVPDMGPVTAPSYLKIPLPAVARKIPPEISAAPLRRVVSSIIEINDEVPGSRYSME